MEVELYLIRLLEVDQTINLKRVSDLVSNYTIYVKRASMKIITTTDESFESKFWQRIGI